jgi:FMN-dependent oxidoreductase (nitrilotriacetate monooxygenase family)
VRRIDLAGKWFNVRGPLNVSRPPQGRPVFIQAGASDRGRDFAARWAEIVFVTPGLVDVAVEFRNDLRARAAKFGRNPDTLKVLPGIAPVIADTEKQAKALCDELYGLAHPTAGLSTLSYHLGVDLSLFPQDQVLPENLDVPGVEGHYREVSELTRRSGLSLAELGQRYGAGRTTIGFTGTPGSVADRMQEWFEAGACDGFMLQIPYFPGGVEDVVHRLVPELQRRGVFRTEYDGTTLRDSLGIARPAN